MFLFILGKIVLFLMVTHASGMKLISTNKEYVLSPQQAHYYWIETENDTQNIALKSLQVDGVICRYENTNDVHIGILGDNASKETLSACLPNATIHLIDNPADKRKKYLAFWTTTAIFNNTKNFHYFSLYSQDNKVHLRFNNLIKKSNPMKDCLLLNELNEPYNQNSNSIIKGDIAVHQYLNPEDFIVSSLLYTNNNISEYKTCNELIFALYYNNQYKVVDTINNSTIVCKIMTGKKTLKDIWNNLHNNNIVSNQHSITYQDTQDPYAKIIIDDAYNEKNDNTFTVNVLLRLILNSTQSNLNYTIYCLYKGVYSSKQSYLQYQHSFSDVKFLQIEQEKGFFSEPIYFNNLYTTNSILPLDLCNQYIKTSSNNNVYYTVVEKIDDYFKQSPEKKKSREQYILNNDRSIVTKINNKDDHFKQTLPDNIQKALKDVKTFFNDIKNGRKNIDISIITSSLETILNATQQNLSYIQELCTCLYMLCNSATAQSKQRENKIQEEIEKLTTASTKVFQKFQEKIDEMHPIIKQAQTDVGNIKTELQNTVNNAQETFTTTTKKLQKELVQIHSATTEKNFKECQDMMQTLKNDYSTEYTSSIANLNKKFNEKLNEKYNEIKSLTERTVESAKNATWRLRHTIGQLATIKQTTEQANQKLADTILAIDAAKKKVSDIITKLEEMQAKIELNLKNLKNIEALQKDLDTANTNITNLQINLKKTNETISTLQTDLNTANEKIASSQGFNWRLNFCTIVCALYLLLQIQHLIAEGRVHAISNDLINIFPIPA